MADHDDHDAQAEPWWYVPPPWTCTRCGVSFGLTEGEREHFEGGTFCADPACSRLCARCFRSVVGARRMSEGLGIDVEPQEPNTHYVIEPHQTTVISPTGVTVEKIPTLIAPPIGTPWPEDEDDDD